ncbi:conserved hypothetical protein [Aromatoleum aromaticum EbN1]|uniref:DUF1302 domain-containing protein n=1 Tax=Aromatoleum aromaticum (strain DSM 19018 / LMG 30748 / EbN1) TaxID=76114 RepID=Q5P8R2_AROAE|nr:DUF1302 domain-containing protein [Aromatoleum aromaticum]CAI06297.1 conserved hypothetical protein [Aromatoleum aromaticum EbN1]
MNDKQYRFNYSCTSRIKLISAAVATLCAGMTVSGAVFGVTIDTGNPDLSMRRDNTVKYNASWRVEQQDASGPASDAGAQINTNDGDRNFSRGLISNRLDLLSEFDLRYRNNMGIRVSGAAWYDQVYNESNDRSLRHAASLNQRSADFDEFTTATEKLHGRKAEFLDAFIYGRTDIAGKGLNLKAGRFTQLYGETLFFGANGIAGAQTPLDLARALSVPNSQFKEVARPVGQVSAQLQLSPDMSVGAYYQYEWRESRLPGAGSYFAFADFPGAGGEFLYGPFGLNGTLHRGGDLDAQDSGQGGIQVKFRAGDTEYGLYAAQFHDKLPQFYVRPGLNADPANGTDGDYVLVFAENIRTIGASFATLLGETNVSGELSFRENQPLVASGNIALGLGGADNDDNATFPKGKTMHVSLSAITVLPANALWEGAAFVGEFAYNRVLSVTDNKAALDPNATREASAIQFVFTPEYFQVMPGLDLQVPIGVNYGLAGRSSVNGVLFPSENGGSLSIGVKADYRKTWQGGLNYTHYIGSSGSIVNPEGELSYDNFHGDRDFVSLTIQRTF